MFRSISHTGTALGSRRRDKEHREVVDSRLSVCRTRARRKDTEIPGAGVMGPRRDHGADRKGTRGVQRLRSRQVGGSS